ncbi:hypothetical protein EDB81DRAFT_228545 [Dactylonectria macrodidyma]|uniref:Uncharacterized protein n=1 Tax=Dactylonectria macrodidyma TaxID=307937 RepID=A0A9P9DMP7_9HYPO|nr:hypothetical protein EDB81DRAFT_228545 [Dactylonectria macrodidyma]
MIAAATKRPKSPTPFQSNCNGSTRVFTHTALIQKARKKQGEGGALNEQKTIRRKPPAYASPSPTLPSIFLAFLVLEDWKPSCQLPVMCGVRVCVCVPNAGSANATFFLFPRCVFLLLFFFGMRHTRTHTLSLSLTNLARTHTASMRTSTHRQAHSH